MRETTIDHLAYVIKKAHEINKTEPIVLNKPIVFLGAGASKTGGIPLAREIVTDILSDDDLCNHPRIKALGDTEKTYSKLMECIEPFERNHLLKKYIDNARVNMTHIYLAQLLKRGYVDYVLTVNFDNLMLRASALFHYFPPTYDMAILKDLTTTNFKERSVVYLHGQHHGLWLLNTPEETAKVNDVIPPILNKLTIQRPMIFIGYSGEDPIFDHITKLGRFDHGLYWVAYHENLPNKRVIDGLLNQANKNAYLIKGYDSDSFMLTLNRELGLPEPAFIEKPFSFLEESFNNIVDIDDKEHFKVVKERLSIVRDEIITAREQFEEGKIEDNETLKVEVEKNRLKREMIDRLISQKYDRVEIEEYTKRANEYVDEEINTVLSGIYNNWGNSVAEHARLKEDEDLFRESFKLYEKAAELDPNSTPVYNNWAYSMSILAERKEDEGLFRESFRLFEKATDLNPNSSPTYFNWGNSASDLARLKEDESLFRESFRLFQKATDLDPNFEDAYNNWGNSASDLARLKEDESLFRESFRPYEKAIMITSNDASLYSNYGFSVADLARLKKDEDLFRKSFGLFEKATNLDPNFTYAYFNWGSAALGLARLREDEGLFRKSFRLFEKATDLDPNLEDAYNHWGNSVSDLAEMKKDEDLFRESFKLFEKATDLDPNFAGTYNNWGISVSGLAEIKEDEDLFRESFRLFKKAIDLDPNFEDAYNNWGNSVSILAEMKKDEGLFRESFRLFEKATDLEPDGADAYSNWGKSVSNLAEMKEDEGLFRESFRLFEKATDLNPNDTDAYDNWGISVLALGKLKGDASLINDSIELSKKGYKLDGDPYNISCAYALLHEKENALKYLKESLENGHITVDHVETDEDWEAYVEDKDFMAVLGQYRKEG